MDTTHSERTPQAAHSQAWYLLRLEGLAVFIGAIVAYAHLGANGWIFAALLLAPDLSMLGFLAGKHIGSTSYNLAHLYVAPVILLALAFSGGWTLGVELALIWIAHIGMDRTIGYGFKYPTAFKDTHLGRV